MALGTFRPGVHSITWNAVALGLTTSEGPRLRARRKSQPINNTQTYGDSLIDGIHRGYTATLAATLKEFNASVQAAMWPTSPTGPPATFDGIIGKIGYLDSGFAKIMTVVAEASSPAATNSPSATFTAGLALLAPENDLEFAFGPVEGDMPFLWDLLVYDDSGTKRLFKWG